MARSSPGIELASNFYLYSNYKVKVYHKIGKASIWEKQKYSHTIKTIEKIISSEDYDKLSKEERLKCRIASNRDIYLHGTVEQRAGIDEIDFN